MRDKLEIARKLWNLKQVDIIQEGQEKLICSARSDIYGDVIVKINDHTKEFISEYRGLQSFQGRGCCTLFNCDETNHILLEERLQPGTRLREIQDFDTRIHLFLNAFQKLHSNREEKEIRRKSYDSYLDWLERTCHRLRNQENTIQIKEQMQIAYQIGQEIFQKYPQRVLLHGDLHHDNIVLSQKEYKIIDPKGVIGPPIFDLPRFLLNELDPAFSSFGVVHIRNTIETLSKELNYPTIDLCKLFYMEVVLANAWCIEDGEDPSVCDLFVAETLYKEAKQQERNQDFERKKQLTDPLPSRMQRAIPFDYEIIPYQEELHKQSLFQLLEQEPYVYQQFINREKQGCDIRWVAVLPGGKVIGILSHAGRFKWCKMLEYVSNQHRGSGVGSALFAKADQFYKENQWTERVSCEYLEKENATGPFIRSHGFHLYCSQYDMELLLDPLTDYEQSYQKAREKICVKDYHIRNYKDHDFAAYNDVEKTAFWVMREKVGMRPNLYTSLSAKDQIRLNQQKEDCFVLIERGSLIGICELNGNEISVLAIRPDKHRQGYGRLMLSYAINELKRRGFEKVTLNCVTKNPAFYLYQQLGFGAKHIHHECYKYYLPDSRPTLIEGLANEQAILREFQQYGFIRKNRG